MDKYIESIIPIFPIRNEELYNHYEKQQSCFWILK